MWSGTGVSAILLILFCMILALTLAYLLGRLLHIPRRLAVLIGVGTAICGNSAIIATAPVIEAKDEDVSIAVATITFFGTLAVILYPIIGYLLGMSDQHVRHVGRHCDSRHVAGRGGRRSVQRRGARRRHGRQAGAQHADRAVILAIGIVYARSQQQREASVKLTSGKSCRGSSSASWR